MDISLSNNIECRVGKAKACPPFLIRWIVSHSLTMTLRFTILLYNSDRGTSSAMTGYRSGFNPTEHIK